MGISVTGLGRRVRQLLRCVARGEAVAVTQRDFSPAFGMWKDRADMADVHAYVRRLRGSSTDSPGLALDPGQPTETD